MTEPLPVRCATHPDVETSLRCGRCGKPICPRCMLTTPVGARCRECARLYVPPTYRISFVYYLRAFGAALGTALVVGAAWGFLRSYLGWYGPIFTVLVGYGVGLAIAFFTGLAVNRKRGIGMVVIGALAVLVCFATVELIFYLRFGHLLSSSYPHVMTAVAAVLGIVVIVYRLR